MPKFAFQDFHGKGCDVDYTKLDGEQLVDATSFEEAFKKLAGTVPDCLGDVDDPYIRHLGDSETQVFFTLAKVK